MNQAKAAVGLSGGVDSAVAAALLVDAGYDVIGVFLECWREPGCRTDADRKDALSVALKLKIPFKVLDFKTEYRQKVVDYFYSEYAAGRTPNPDVMCNQEIKFGLFYDWCLDHGFDYVATGHYARIFRPAQLPRAHSYLAAGAPEEALRARTSVHGLYALARGVDEHKDQSYFLYRLRQEQLPQILFPVGGMTKVQVRQEAKRRGLSVADKPDSQGICFIGEVDVRELLRRKLGVKRGEVVDTQGRVVGEHDGVWFYTIGQRHGFNAQPQSASVSPLYVIYKDVKKNRLVVGFGPETYRSGFKIGDIHWIKRLKTRSLLVRIRHLGKLIECVLDGSRVKLAEPQRGVAPGQSAVFYDGEVCLGGGVIQ